MKLIASTENTAPPFAVFPDASMSQWTLSLAASIRMKCGREVKVSQALNSGQRVYPHS